MPTLGDFEDVRFAGSKESDRQFSSDVSGNPEDLLEQTRASVEAHADLNYAYGLCQPTADLGSHPWLRDSLADASEREPGNAEPQQDVKTPFRR